MFEEPTENWIEEAAVRPSLSLRRKTFNIKIHLISKETNSQQ